jgi:hypothetical protein
MEKKREQDRAVLISINKDQYLSRVLQTRRSNFNLYNACVMYLPDTLSTLLYDKGIQPQLYEETMTNEEVIQLCMKEYTSSFDNVDDMMKTLFAHPAGDCLCLLSACAENNIFMVDYLLARCSFPAYMIGCAFITACGNGNLAIAVLLRAFSGDSPKCHVQSFFDETICASGTLSTEYCLVRALYAATEHHYFGIADYLVRLVGDRLAAYEAEFAHLRQKDPEIDARVSDEAKERLRHGTELRFPSRFSLKFEV